MLFVATDGRRNGAPRTSAATEPGSPATTTATTHPSQRRGGIQRHARRGVGQLSLDKLELLSPQMGAASPWLGGCLLVVASCDSKKSMPFTCITGRALAAALNVVGIASWTGIVARP
jgi:hypothetical protein